MCEKCLYRKNCQFLAKHKGVIVTDCTAFNDEEELKANIKAEAVKEYINKAKEEMLNFAKIEINEHYYYLVGTSFFDNLLKETVGDAE